MDTSTATERGASAPGTSARTAEFDWRAIERSPEFRELVRLKRRFIVPAAMVFLGSMLLYLLLAAFADGFMGSQIVDGLPVGWALAAFQVFMTWAVTWLYLRKADREWEPLERRAAERAAEVVSGAEPSGDEARFHVEAKTR